MSSTPDRSRAPRSRLRRWLARSLWLALALVAILALAWGFRDELIAPLAVRIAERMVRERTGATLEIGRVTTGPRMSSIHVEGLSWKPRAGHSVMRLVSAADLEAELSLGALWRREPGAIGRVRARGVVLEIDSAAKREPGPIDETQKSMPERLPALEITDLRLDWRLENGGHLLVEGGNVSADADASGNPAAVSARVVRAEDPKLGLHEGELRASLTYSKGVLAIASLAFSGREVARDSVLDLSKCRNGEVGWDAHLALFGGTADVRGAWTHGITTSACTLHGIELARGWQRFRPDESDPPTARLDLIGDVAFGGGLPFSVSASGVASDVGWKERCVERLEAELSFTPDLLAIARLDARDGANRVRANDAAIPLSGSGGALETLRASRGHVDLELRDVRALVDPTSELARVAPPHLLEVAGDLASDGVELESARLETAGGSFTLHRGRFAWGTAPGDWLRDASIDLDLETDFRDLSALGALFSSEPWGGSLQGRLHLSGPWRDPIGEVDLSGDAVTASGLALGDLRVQAEIDARSIRVGALDARGELAHVAGRGTFELASQRLEAAHLELESDALSKFLPAWFASGSVRLEAELSGPWREPTGSFDVHAKDVEILGQDFLRGRPLEALDVRGSDVDGVLTIEALEARAGGVVMQASGSVRHEEWTAPLAVSLESFSVAREGLDLELREPIAIAVHGRDVSFHGMLLGGSAGELALDFDGRGPEFELDLALEGLDPMPLLAPFVPEGFFLSDVHGTLRVTRASGATALASDLSVHSVRFASGAPEFSFRGKVDIGDGRARFDPLELRQDAETYFTLRGEMPFDPLGDELLGQGPLELHGELAAPRLGDFPWELVGLELPFEGDLRSSFDFAGTWDEVHGSLAFDATSLALGTPAAFNQVRLGPAAVTARLNLAETVTIERFEVDAPGQGRLELTGSWSQAGSLRALIAERGRGVGAVPLALHANLEVGDLGFLSGLSSELRRVGGAMTASLEVGGTAIAPAFAGEMKLEHAELRLERNFPTIDSVEATLVFVSRARSAEADAGSSGDAFDRSVQIQALHGELGGAPFRLSGGIELRDAGPYLALAFEGTEVLMVQSPTVRVRGDTRLACEGPLDALRVEGNVDVTEGRWSKQLDYLRAGANSASATPIELFSIREGPLRTMTLNVRILTKRPFEMKNNLVNGSLRADLTLEGDGYAPGLVGTIFCDPARVFLPASTLRLTAGTVELTRNDPLVPQLDLELETRTRGYDVKLHITGTSIDPKVELSSVPPLAPEDLLLLVLTGQPPEEGLTARAGEQAAQTVAVYVGKDLVSRWFGIDDHGDGASLFERIEWQVGRDVTRAGSQTTQVSLRLSEEDKSHGRTWFLRGEKDAYDRINFGVRLLYRFD